MLRVYNTTARDVDEKLTYKGAQYLIGVLDWQREPDYKPKAGDLIFRYMTDAEAEQLARPMAKQRWIQAGRTNAYGLKFHLRAVKKELETFLVLVKLEPPQEL